MYVLRRIRVSGGDGVDKPSPGYHGVNRKQKKKKRTFGTHSVLGAEARTHLLFPRNDQNQKKAPDNLTVSRSSVIGGVGTAERHQKRN